MINADFSITHLTDYRYQRVAAFGERRMMPRPRDDDQSDLMQRWENGPVYIFLESPDEQEELAVYLKDREAEGVKSVHFYFPNDLDASRRIINHIIIRLAGFSDGVAAFTKRCEQTQ